MLDTITKNGYKVIGTITSVKGKCNAGHKVGDQFDLSVMSSGGLCGWLYRDLFPHLWLLQCGGNMIGNTPDHMERSIPMRCPDIDNEVMISLKPIRPVK